MTTFGIKEIKAILFFDSPFPAKSLDKKEGKAQTSIASKPMNDKVQNRIVLNKEQAHIVNEFFRKYGSAEQVWKIDNKIYDLLNDILAAHFVIEEESGCPE